MGYMHMFRVPWMLCSHAYIITREFGQEILAKSPYMPFDVAINFWSPLASSYASL